LRILLDECLPEILREWLPGREVKTVQELGWAGVTNGQLLRWAEEQFDVFLTADRRLRYQQNLKGRGLAVVVLPSNRLKVLRGVMAGIEAAIAKGGPGKAEQYFELAWPEKW
jgi:hypothetical protein